MVLMYWVALPVKVVPELAESAPAPLDSATIGEPAKAAMFEDLARNLEVPHALGMITVLVVPQHSREVFREAWELEGRDAPHVDHVTDDLTGFIEGIVGREA